MILILCTSALPPNRESFLIATGCAGEDVWNCYELSWLDMRGAPRRGILELRVPCETPRLVESKSLKLYLNSLNFKQFESEKAMLDCIATDLLDVLGGRPQLALLQNEPDLIKNGEWQCIDDEEVDMVEFQPDETVLSCEKEAKEVEERLVSHLLRTNCPVTNQPDWGSVLIHYRGPKIDRKGLKKYVCSLRREVGFHELCTGRYKVSCVSLMDTS
jgi:7-cyano-7-deazaguanine reductase